jgi:proline dehydrogenase
MEQSVLVPATLALFERLMQDGYTNVGIVLQAALYRSEDDVRRMNELGARVRLVKGAYKEPGSIAFQKKKDVDAAFVRLMRRLLTDGVQPAIATHDPVMIAATCAAAREQACPPGFFEFQMLFGVRRDLQTSLRAQGLPLRVYVPFGREWFPYFMRRLAERPANVAFVIRGILHEHMGHGHTFR